MKKFENIEWLFFDFGGTLDSPGIHSRKLFFNCFNEILCDLDNKIFQDAYTFADELMVSKSLIVKADLFKMNEVMCSLITNKLDINENISKNAANLITQIQTKQLLKNQELLKVLSKHFKLGIVSNFSGNLEIILREFDIHHFFTFIIDSYYTGFKKPQSEIYVHALKLAGIPASQAIFVGDNLERDIVAPKCLGFSTIWIDRDLKKNVHADETVDDLEELLHLIQ